MASSVDVTPAIGNSALTQVGPTLGYDAVDWRRLGTGGMREGLLSDGTYVVSQRAAGVNRTVDVAAATGNGFFVQGDAVSAQGLYYVPPSSAVINVDIAASDATNPRNDLVVLEVKDNTHDGGGLNHARVRVVTGTPNALAVSTDAFGVHGTPALPDSAVPLAVVCFPAVAASVTDAMIDDRRPRTEGKKIIATSESRTNVAFGLLTTPDRVRNIVMPTDGVIEVTYQATWQQSAASAAEAAIFLNSTQSQIASPGGPISQSEVMHSATTARDLPLCSIAGGLYCTDGSAYAGDVSTGQIIGNALDPAGSPTKAYGGSCKLFAAAGTYDVSIRFKASSGSVTVKNRRLLVESKPYGN